MGDTDLPKFPITNDKPHEDSRTGLIEAKRKFSAMPAPRGNDPPRLETRCPAKAATVAGAKAMIEDENDQTFFYLNCRIDAISLLIDPPFEGFEEIVSQCIELADELSGEAVPS